MTTVAVLQPSYLPWLGFFEQMYRADIFIYFDDVQFDKNGWRNRNRIKTANGLLWLTVPVSLRNSKSRMIFDIRISENNNWRKKHFLSLKQAYADAKHCDQFLPQIDEIISFPWVKLADLNIELIESIRKVLGIKCDVYRSSDLKIRGGQTTRLLNICRHFSANTYYSGASAKNYLQCSDFEDHNIEIEWQHYCSPHYRQLHGPFVPNLSAIDYVFNEGATTTCFSVT